MGVNFPNFTHLPSNMIVITDMTMTLDQFRTFEPDYSLPASYTYRYYCPEMSIHILSTGKDQFGGPVPWPEGDTYIANEAEYKKKLAAVQEQAMQDQQTYILSLSKDQIILGAEWLLGYVIDNKIVDPEQVPKWLMDILNKRKVITADVAASTVKLVAG